MPQVAVHAKDHFQRVCLAIALTKIRVKKLLYQLMNKRDKLCKFCLFFWLPIIPNSFGYQLFSIILVTYYSQLFWLPIIVNCFGYLFF